MPDAGVLAREVAGVAWYHSIELPGGIVTPGVYDTRASLRHVPLPERLDGLRCLDIGTADGFWAFEMERRGAAEVVGIDVERAEDLDWPGVPDPVALAYQRGRDGHRRDGFDLARRALGARARRVERRVYDLDPERDGRFDFAFAGSILVHLRDPIGALMAVERVLDGRLLSADPVSVALTALHPRRPVARLQTPGWPAWWALNLRAYRRLFPAAGLRVEATGRPYALRAGASRPPAQQRGPRLSALVTRRLGVPHAWVLAVTLTRRS